MDDSLKYVLQPEMGGKIVDESHFNFHVTCKAKMINAINNLKNGMDLLGTLGKLKFNTDKRWLNNTCNDPIVRVLLETLEEYKKHEHRPTRAKILIPLIEYGIALFASDLFFKERGEWFLYQLIKRSPEMEFHDCFIDPKRWYPLTRNSGDMQGEDGNYYKIENDPNAIPIEQEYIKWYGIDPMSDMTDIPEDLKQRVINENIAWVKENAASYFRYANTPELTKNDTPKP